MNFDDLKWNESDFQEEQVSKEAMIAMLNVNNHPALKRIRMQLIVESALGIIFLVFYYDFFDGHLRSTIWNVLLILAIGLIPVHNLLGYEVIKNPINGINVINSLKFYLGKIRRYSYVSIFARIFALIIIFGYFLSGLESFETRHYWSVGLLLMPIGIQVYLLRQVWAKRIDAIALKYEQFTDKK